ncbi:MAG TPA: 6,7-dimethyl-8-ribityllumazine synthase [Saprospiraceae bacterium]|nr:6,7-dimethyl-8-ribityllumazine synthase [Saprospiraceae bacterium]
MASALKNLSQYDDTTIPTAKEMKFGIVVAEWHTDITHALYEACADTLEKHGATSILTAQVPGTFELTAGAAQLINNKKLDAVICIGCVIKGETSHNEYINHAVANGITMLSVQTGIPVIFGVLTPNNHQQALDRAGGKYGNKGVEAAVTAIRMVDLKNSLAQKERKIGY